jgi:uncharacterized protein (TIGR02588 family)
MMKRSVPTSHPESDSTKRTAEAIAGFIGAVIALVTIAIIAWDGFNDDGIPPIVVAEPGEVHPHDGGFLLGLSVFNRGDAAAAQVVVEGTLARGDEILETSEITFDYVPSGARRNGGLYFTADPRTHDVAVRAKGYVDP